MDINEKECLSCQRPLKGRVDKKFCDDYCRNSYNNKQNSDQTNFVRNVNNLLRKNRRILQEALGEKDTVKVKKEYLMLQGWQAKYHTHEYVTQRMQKYLFCYEYGWLLLDDDIILIVKREA